MRILFVSSDANPFGVLDNGDAQRTRMLLQACAMLGDVDVITFREHADSDMDHVNVVYSDKVDAEIRPFVAKVKKWMAIMPWTGVTALFPVNHKRERIVDDVVKKGRYDLIVTRYLFRASACGLLKYRDRLVIDFDDSPAFFFLSQHDASSSWFRKVRLNCSARKIDRLTPKLISALSASFFADQQTALKYKGIFLPNIPYFNATCPDADFSVPYRKILFVGLLDYPPNCDGLDCFLEKVYPSLREAMPQVQFEIVGRLRIQAIADRWRQYPGVHLAGFVDDLKSEYTNAHVVVIPVYRCGGTNIKLLEAMAMNRACVTTAEAYEKMCGQFENGRDLYAAANDEEYVAMVLKLLTDENENLRIAHNGKMVMDRYYSFDTFSAIVKKVLTR